MQKERKLMIVRESSDKAEVDRLLKEGWQITPGTVAMTSIGPYGYGIAMQLEKVTD